MWTAVSRGWSGSCEPTAVKAVAEASGDFSPALRKCVLKRLHVVVSAVSKGLAESLDGLSERGYNRWGLAQTPEANRGG